MGDQLMGFPTPAEVFGESKTGQGKSSKSRKPPPMGAANGSPIGSPHYPQQMQQRVSSGPVYQPPPPQQQAQQQAQAHYYPPPPPHPQQQQRTQYHPQQQQQYAQPVIPQQQQQQVQIQPQQQYRQPASSSRHSSQPSLYTTHSGQSNASVAYKTPIANQQPQIQQQHQHQLIPRTKKEIFESIDRNGSGSISFQELANGLANKDGSRFALRSSSSVFRLFDSDESQSLTYNEFSRLFDTLDRWKTCFVMADKNDSNSLSFSEFQDALQVLGYRLSTDTALFVFQTFSGANLDLRFDMFIESCVYLIGITRVFKKFDPQGNGVAVIQFENFVEEVLKIKTRI